MRLTDLGVRSLAPPERGQKTYWEGQGFGVRVSQGGTKSFVLMIGVDRRLVTLGRYPEMSLKEARQAAIVARSVKPAPKVRISFPEARDEYLRECERKNRPGTVHVYRNYLRKITKRNISDIGRNDIDLSSPHAVTTMKVFFNWCIRNDLAEKNPFSHERVSYGQRERVLSDEELVRIYSYQDGRYSTILRLLILTGLRIGEVSRLEKSWVTADTIVVPASVAKNKRQHTIPFNLLTAQHLGSLEEYNGFSKAKRRLDELLQIPHWTHHDLRRTFATIHARIGTPVHVVEAMLNHSSGTISGVAAVYIRHNFLREMRVACLKYELFIAKLVSARV